MRVIILSESPGADGLAEDFVDAAIFPRDRVCQQRVGDACVDLRGELID